MDWKSFWKKLLFPPVWVVAVLSVASGVSLTAVFWKGWEQTLIAYPIYVLAFYSLSILCAFCVKVLPGYLRNAKARFRSTALGNRFLTDRAFRTAFSLQLSLGISLLYVGINLLSWYWVRSWWFVVLAAYYGIMAVMRFLLVGYVRRNTIGASIREEWHRARICGCVLLLVNLSLSGAVLMILYQNRGYDYPGILIYVMALYTFYSVIHAIVETVRCRALGSPVMSAAKIVSLSAAVVSLLNLETAMFAQFGGEMARKDQQLMIILTGAGVSVTVVALSAGLIVKATKEIGREKHGE